MGYALGRNSKKILLTCTPELQQVINLAIELTDVDFSVVEGIRTPEKQRENMNATPPVSWTMASRHMANDDGYSEAVDIYPWVDGMTCMNQADYMRVARSIFSAAQILQTPIAWGGFWLKPRVDNPHWELMRR